MCEDIENFKIQLGHLLLPQSDDEHFRLVVVEVLSGILEILEKNMEKASPLDG